MTGLRDLLDSNIVRTILAILGICVTITIYLLNRKRKELSYEVIRNDRLFQLSLELKSRVEITLDGNRVDDVSLAIIDIANTGTEPIERDDFDKPFTIRFGGTEIISARILRKKPKDLDASISTTNDELVLSPLLLNTRDTISIEVTMTEAAQTVTHSARIVGIPEIKDSVTDYGSYLDRVLLVLSGLASFVMVWFSTGVQVKQNAWVFSAKIDFLIMLAIFALGAFSAFRLGRRRGRRRALRK